MRSSKNINGSTNKRKQSYVALKASFMYLHTSNQTKGLPSLSATSQLYSQAPKADADQLPVVSDGGILDIHLTSFVSSIDNLLTAGRSQSPRRVLSPMMAVVNAVSAILGDLRFVERKRGRVDIDNNLIHTLQERAEATLSNLVATANTHATSMGMAPISLLDAAASHLSVTVTEIGKLVYIRKASKAEQERFRALVSTSTMPASSPVSSLSSIDDNTRTTYHQRQVSIRRSDNNRSIDETLDETNSKSSILRLGVDTPQRQRMLNDGPFPDSSEDGWLELKVSKLCFAADMNG